MHEFKNKTVFISGAGTGIGAATSLLYAQHGAHLILVGRNKENLEKTAQKAREFDVNVETHSLDVNNTRALKDLICSLSQLDIAINNAGVEGSVGDIVDLSEDDYDHVMNTNLKSVWLAMQEQLIWMRKRKHPGQIINISSIAGIRAFAGSSLYVASKHALIGMSQAVALEQIQFGIRVNIVSPGAVETPMLSRIFSKNWEGLIRTQPIKRLAKPEEIAEGILWLTSEKSSFLVGHNLVIDGGRSL